MSSRASFRRKVVLPVMVIRRGGQEKQLAHTLDLTEASARLGGIASPLEPGEVVEVQRGAVKAKFQVIWMGAQSGALACQAGIRSLEINKCIWNVDLPKDEIDMAVDTSNLRRPMPAIPGSPGSQDERRWHPRYACNGSVSAKTAGSAFATQGEAKDISKGGVYVEVSAPLPMNSSVNMELHIEDIRFEATGSVRTSYPLLGMGISFQKLTPENAEKLAIVVERARRKAEREQALSSVLPDTPESAETAAPDGHGFKFEENIAPLLAKTCRNFAEDFDRWKSACSDVEIEELKIAIHQLQQKLSSAPGDGFMKYLPQAAQISKTV